MHYEDDPSMDTLNAVLMSLVRDGWVEMGVDDDGEFIFFMTDEQKSHFEQAMNEHGEGEGYDWEPIE